MTFSGMLLGFTKGWSLSLAMLAVGPIILIGMVFFGASIQKRTGVVMQAYAQSAGYAE